MKKNDNPKQRARIDRLLAIVAVFALLVLGATVARADDTPAAAEAPAQAPPIPASPASAAAAAPETGAAPEALERLQITDPYIELRTGPGRGYPIFYVAPRGQWIDIELRHTDWFKIHTEDGKVGWVNRAQLQSTLTAGGEAKSFRDILLDDYLTRRTQLGAAWGHFDSQPMLKLWGSYRLSDTLSLEGTIGQVQGVFSGTDFWHVNVMSEPWSDQRISPFFTIGVGKFTNFPNLSLVAAPVTNSKMANAGIGARYYVSDRFVLRADYSLYTVFVADTHSNEYHAFTLGLSFFF